MSNLPHHCPRCPSRWSGYNTAHCSVCHRTFTGVNTFDKHRVRGKCVDPEAVVNKKGERVLALTNREYPCWGVAGEKPPFWEEGG